MTTFRDEVSGSGTAKPELVMDNTFAESGSLSERVDISPVHIVRRTSTSWDGVAADTIEFTRRELVSYRLRPRSHMLIISEQQTRDDGETLIEGLPKSTLHEFSHKLSFVPSGHEFYGWQRPRVLPRFTYLYLDPKNRLLESELRFSDLELSPRLFFFDQNLWESALKLKMLAGQDNASAYAEALALVIAHELIRIERGIQPTHEVRGGLASWQKKRIADYIEEHLRDDISIRALAVIIRLSPYHFAHAFKQSFGEPPHRYVTSRRMLRAKSLLAGDTMSVTEIGRALGFVETSSFTTAFRRFAGITPSSYRRQLG
jgi:AraC family transcriptional regulator